MLQSEAEQRDPMVRKERICTDGCTGQRVSYVCILGSRAHSKDSVFCHGKCRTLW